MQHWYMMTLVGEDRAGIVAMVANALYQGGCNLGESSMLRLGGNFTIMMMVQSEEGMGAVRELVAPVAESLGLHLHIDHIKAHLHQHQVPDVRLTVYGADRAGIVAKVAGALAEAGLHILDMASDVAGSRDKPIYIMQIEGHAAQGIESLQAALELIRHEGVDAHIEVIETLIG